MKPIKKMTKNHLVLILLILTSKKLFDNKYISTNAEAFDVKWKDIKNHSSNTQYSLYFLISKNLEVSEDEAEAMVDFIKEGNDMFIAADFIDENLLDKIKCKTERLDEIISEVHGKMNETENNNLVRMFILMQAL